MTFKVGEKTGLSLKNAYKPNSEKTLESTTTNHQCIACEARGNYITGDLGPLQENGPLRFYRGAMKCACGYMNFCYVIVNDIPSIQKDVNISTEKALIHAEKLGTLPDWRVEELLNLSSAAAHNENYHSAMDLTKACLELDDANQAAWYNMGWLYTNTQDIVNAVKAYQKVIDIGSSFPSAHLNLGYIYEEAGDLDNAISSFQAFLKCYPNHAGAKKRLNNCKKRAQSA